MTSVLNREYLEKILPHKGKMVLLDDVIDYDIEKRYLEAVVTIRKDSLFFDKNINGVSSLLGIEYMAQAVGCYAYYRNKLNEPKIGYLLGTRLYNNKLEKFELGKTFKIRVEENFYSNDIASFGCLIYNDENEEVASAALNVYQEGLSNQNVQ